jgi:hypothetical protein
MMFMRRGAGLRGAHLIKCFGDGRFVSHLRCSGLESARSQPLRAGLTCDVPAALVGREVKTHTLKPAGMRCPQIKTSSMDLRAP